MRPSFDSSFERRAENVLRERRCQVRRLNTRDAHVIVLRRFVSDSPDGLPQWFLEVLTA
jgi:hypothetical protein